MHDAACFRTGVAVCLTLDLCGWRQVPAGARGRRCLTPIWFYVASALSMVEPSGGKRLGVRTGCCNHGSMVCVSCRA